MNYIFDLFGTLITDNIDVYTDIMSDSFGLDKEGYKLKVREFISTNNFPSRDEALDSLLAHLDTTMDPEARSRFFERIDDWKDGLQLYDGALDVLRNLRENGAKIALLSNNNTFIEDVINRVGLQDYVDVIVTSHISRLLKPTKEAYELCLTKLGSNADGTIMVGDQLEKDVLAPIKLGMKGILFDPNNKSSDYDGKRITSLRELI